MGVVMGAGLWNPKDKVFKVEGIYKIEDDKENIINIEPNKIYKITAMSTHNMIITYEDGWDETLLGMNGLNNVLTIHPDTMEGLTYIQIKNGYGDNILVETLEL